MAEPLDRAAIEANLTALGDRLAMDGAEVRLLIVGGSYLALHGLRESTVDVDTITRLDATTRDAIEAVAAERGLEPAWLNDHAAAFAPSSGWPKRLPEPDQRLTGPCGQAGGSSWSAGFGPSSQGCSRFPPVTGGHFENAP